MFAPYSFRLLKPGNAPRLRAWGVGLVQYLINEFVLVCLKIRFAKEYSTFFFINSTTKFAFWLRGGNEIPA